MNESETPIVDDLDQTVQGQNWGYADMRSLARTLEKRNKRLVEALRLCRFAIQGYKDTNPLHPDSVLHRALMKAKTALAKQEKI